MTPGVGSIQPNESEDEEDQEPEELESDGWMRLLNYDNGVLSLKPWTEVSDARANKSNIALALRAVMRQAWGEFTIFYNHFLYSNISHPAQWGRRGNIPWAEVKTDQKSIISSRFLLKAKIGNPTRMSLNDITDYWIHWVSKDKKGDPFCFGVDGEGDKSSSSGTDKGAAEKLPSVSSDNSIDDIPYPFLCHTSHTRTNCLQKLVLNKGETGNMFHALVGMVDTLEVSP